MWGEDCHIYSQNLTQKRQHHPKDLSPLKIFIANISKHLIVIHKVPHQYKRTTPDENGIIQIIIFAIVLDKLDYGTINIMISDLESS